MWRSAGLDIMINQQRLLDVSVIGELLLIDNCPEKSRKLHHHKIRTIHSGSNLFVNPSWNLGVKVASYEQICLLSDDVIFDPNIFIQLANHVRSEIGITGIGKGCDIGISGNIHPKKINLEVCNLDYREYETQFGCTMFFHKDAYYPVPEEAKIFLGDYWLFLYNNRKRKVQNYNVTNMDIIMEHSATSRGIDMVQVARSDFLNRDYLFDTYFPR